MTDRVHNKPCAGCPYRRDCPSGVWHEDEYEKLREFDAPTGEQPPAVFLCHDGDRESTLCRGWLEVHDPTQLLAIRIGVLTRRIDASIFDLELCGVPLFDSGDEAARHGLRDINEPGEEACLAAFQLLRRHPDLKTKGDHDGKSHCK